MTNTPAVGNLIRDKKTIQIPSIIQSSRNLGMHLLNDDLASLIIHGRVTREEAMAVSNDPVSLDKMC